MVATVRIMGCVSSRHIKHPPGYEDPVILAAETSCKHLQSFCSLYFDNFVSFKKEKKKNLILLFALTSSGFDHSIHSWANVTWLIESRYLFRGLHRTLLVVGISSPSYGNLICFVYHGSYSERSRSAVWIVQKVELFDNKRWAYSQGTFSFTIWMIDSHAVYMILFF